MENIEYSKDLVSDIKDMLLKYCPYMENRLDLIDSKEKEFDIILNINDVLSSVDFVYGNHGSKSGVDKELRVDGRSISLEEVEELIDFIKSDHTYMFYDKHDRHRNLAKFKFNINKDGEESTNGINCSTIGLILNFRYQPELEKKYLYFINKKYFNSSDISIEKEYTEEVIKSYVDSLDKDGLMYLLNQMSEEDLKELLITNIKQISEYVKSETKVKQYFIEK